MYHTARNIFLLNLVFTLPLLLTAQMKDPDSWLNYEQVFGVKNHEHAPDFSALVIRSSEKTNILWPGEQPHYTVQLTNNLKKDLSVTGNIEIMKFAARGGADIWTPEMKIIRLVSSKKVEVQIPSSGYSDLRIDPLIPDDFGAFAIVLDLGKHGRSLITSVVRTFAASAESIQFPKQSLDDIGADNLRRLGIQAIRMGVDYTPTDFVEYRQQIGRAHV